MFKHEFAAFRYIAISLLLRNAPVKYGRSYLHTEADELDLTYFIEFQCAVVLRAVVGFTSVYRKSLADTQDFQRWLTSSGVIAQLTERQRAVYQVAKSGEAKEFTASNVAENFSCSGSEAASILEELDQLQLFERRKMGREWVFFLRSSLRGGKHGSELNRPHVVTT